MTTKLTLTIDDTFTESAKKYAKTNGISLSAFVESYLKSLSAQNVAEEGISPQVSKLMGVIKLQDNYNYKAELGSALSKRRWSQALKILKMPFSITAH